ncbi:hypothetical protein diail_10229 [Diaporthe ilicicola]|nr:hypothetical protein diail_10229 [Diaporthe ilicicola]
MEPDAKGAGSGATNRPAPSTTKRNSAIRKEQNRNASRTYSFPARADGLIIGERRKQKLALLDRFLEKDQVQALPASSQESSTSTGSAPSQLENAEAALDLTPSAGPHATPFVELPSSDHLGEGVEVGDTSAFGDLSFDGSWPLSSNDPIWNFAAEQDDGSGTVQPHPHLPTVALSPSSILGYTGKETSTNNEGVPEPMQILQARHSSAAMTLGPADVFFTTPGQQSMSLLGPWSSRDGTKGKAVASKITSPSSSSAPSNSLALSARSAVTTPTPLPGEDSLAEFMYHLMSLRLSNVKRVIYVQQSGLFAAVMDNTLAIGVMDGPQAIFADETVSPFNRDWINSKGSMQLAQIKSKFSAAPKDLQPVDVQITVEHHVYLDVIPFPSFRERALRALAHDPPLLDEDELCCDICNREGLIVWGSQGNDQGMEACRPWDMRSWEPKPWFLRKYHFLAGGWEGEMWRAARWWHTMRGERIAASPTDSSVST